MEKVSSFNCLNVLLPKCSTFQENVIAYSTECKTQDARGTYQPRVAPSPSFLLSSDGSPAQEIGSGCLIWCWKYQLSLWNPHTCNMGGSLPTSLRNIQPNRRKQISLSRTTATCAFDYFFKNLCANKGEKRVHPQSGKAVLGMLSWAPQNMDGICIS